MSTTLTEDLRLGIAQHAASSQFYREQGESIEGANAENKRLVEEAKTDMNQKADNFINTVVSDYPFYRVTKNSSLEGETGNIPDGWSSGLPGSNYELVETVYNNVLWEDRSKEQKDILTALGYFGARHISKNFNIWRLSWDKSVNSTEYGMLYFYTRGVTMTEMCMSRIESGSVTANAYMTKNIKETWSLTGSHWGKGDMDYGIAHLIVLRQNVSDVGSILFALPQLVAGKYPIESQQLGVIPYIGAGTYE